MDRYVGRIGEWAAWLISLLAWAISFETQRQLVLQHGFGGWESAAWPATTDLAGLVGMLLALDQGRRHRSTLAPWLIAAASAAVMIAANIGAAAGDPVAMLLHAWPPAIALASWFVLVHVRRAQESETVGETADETIEAIADATPRANEERALEATPRRRATPRAAGSVERMRRDLIAHPNATAEDRARRLKVSRQHAYKLIREARQLQVVGE